MASFCPGPSLILGVKSLAIQEGHNKPFKEPSEIEPRLKKLDFIKRAAQTSATVRFVKVAIVSLFSASYENCRQLGVQKSLSFSDSNIEARREDGVAGFND